MNDTVILEKISNFFKDSFSKVSKNKLAICSDNSGELIDKLNSYIYENSCILLFPNKKENMNFTSIKEQLLNIDKEHQYEVYFFLGSLLCHDNLDFDELFGNMRDKNKNFLSFLIVYHVTIFDECMSYIDKLKKKCKLTKNEQIDLDEMLEIKVANMYNEDRTTKREYDIIEKQDQFFCDFYENKYKYESRIMRELCVCKDKSFYTMVIVFYNLKNTYINNYEFVHEHEKLIMDLFKKYNLSFKFK